jgi:hypothetical protein
VTVAPLADVVAEARRILAAAGGIPVRAIGGVAIALSAGRPLLLPREYNDVDLVAAAGKGPNVVHAFDRLGYDSDQRFNALHGHRRLLFFDPGNERQVDVFVGKFEMCHAIPLGGRLTLAPLALPAADLLLTKLQVFALNEKDQRDIVNVLHAHRLSDGDGDGIDAGYVARLLAGDWGLWRTSTLNMERVRGALGRYAIAPEREEVVRTRLDDLRSRIDEEPKSTKWRIRSRIGERVKWYEEPEEVG